MFQLIEKYSTIEKSILPDPHLQNVFIEELLGIPCNRLSRLVGL